MTTINPDTKRPIKIGGAVYKRLVAAGKIKEETNVASVVTKTTSKPTSKATDASKPTIKATTASKLTTSTTKPTQTVTKGRKRAPTPPKTQKATLGHYEQLVADRDAKYHDQVKSVVDAMPDIRQFESKAARESLTAWTSESAWKALLNDLETLDGATERGDLFASSFVRLLELRDPVLEKELENRPRKKQWHKEEKRKLEAMIKPELLREFFLTYPALTHVLLATDNAIDRYAVMGGVTDQLLKVNTIAPERRIVLSGLADAKDIPLLLDSLEDPVDAWKQVYKQDYSAYTIRNMALARYLINRKIELPKEIGTLTGLLTAVFRNKDEELGIYVVTHLPLSMRNEATLGQAVAEATGPVLRAFYDKFKTIFDAPGAVKTEEIMDKIVRGALRSVEAAKVAKEMGVQLGAQAYYVGRSSYYDIDWSALRIFLDDGLNLFRRADFHGPKTTIEALASKGSKILVPLLDYLNKELRLIDRHELFNILKAAIEAPGEMQSVMAVQKYYPDFLTPSTDPKKRNVYLDDLTFWAAVNYKNDLATYLEALGGAHPDENKVSDRKYEIQRNREM